jgi:hypothetical protein
VGDLIPRKFKGRRDYQASLGLLPLRHLHVLAADRLHGDDTTVPILAKGQTETGRVWLYVRDDRPFGGKGPPAALFYASMTAASVSRTTPPSARCAAWPWAGSRGCLLVQSAGRNGRP